MKYAKLIEGEIVYAPNPILIDEEYIGNPSAAILMAQGYKPVRFTDPPETQPGYIAVPGWEESEDEIVQTWEIIEEPITEEDALTRYSNELTGAEDETLTEATETLIKIVKGDG